MSRMVLDHVVVQELISSKHARRKYRLAPQRRPVGEISLEGIDTEKQFKKLWKEYVGETGRFSLLARDSNGRLFKCIAVITVSSNGITFKDSRCALCAMLRNKARNVPDDMSI